MRPRAVTALAQMNPNIRAGTSSKGISSIGTRAVYCGLWPPQNERLRRFAGVRSTLLSLEATMGDTTSHGTRLRVLGSVVLLGFALGCGEPAPAPPAAAPAAAPQAQGAPAAGVEERRAALNALLSEHWEYELRRSPELASTIGDHRYDDRWTDQSPQALADHLEQVRQFHGRFQALSSEGLSEQEQLSHRLIVRNLGETLENARFENWLMPVNQFGGAHLRLPQLVSALRFETLADYQNYAKRLLAVPTVLAQTQELMALGLQKQLLPPREQLERAVDQAEQIAQQKAEESPFYEPVKKFPEAIAAAEQETLRAAVLAALNEQVLPAYRRLSEYLRSEYAPRGRAEPGLWALPEGPARYAAAVKTMTTTSLSASEIHQIGLDEVKRIETEMEAIGKQLGFADLAAFREHIRSDAKLRAKSREEIIERYERYTEGMYAELPKLFGRLPQQRMRILPTESFRERDAAPADYQQGTLDGSRPGTVRVNTYKAEERLWTDMEAIAYHEGVPGHHLQRTIQLELGDLPPFRQFGGYTAFSEGWGLYSERLGKDVGFYRDPYSDYGRLQIEMLRAIRLVVDTGVHEKKWTRDEMVKFFHDHSTIDEPSVQAETNRYIVIPGQALAYKIGQLTILRLREEARERLGERFDIRAFHDLVLGAGALPLDALEQRVDAWIARGGGSAGD
jgi:uncharacterized protein (DUF885 family)